METQLKNVKRKIKILQTERNAIKDEEISLKTSLADSEDDLKFIPSSKAGDIIFEIHKKHSGKKSFLYELEKFFYDLEIKYNESIKHLKNSFDTEKKKFKQISAQQSSVFFVKSELENLFLECVEEVRKDISRRKAKDLLDQKYTKRAKTTHNDEKTLMTPSDKRKILELLISNEQVLIMLYEKLFPHRASSYNGNVKPDDKNYEEPLPDIEELLRQVPKKPSIPKTMSFQHRGRSVV